MRSLKMVLSGDAGVSVDWGSEVSGLTALAQKAANALLTHAGSDAIVVGRGTNAFRKVVSQGAFDLMSIQHTLNFAALKARRDVRSFETIQPAEERLSDLRMRVAGISNNAAQVEIIVTNAEGTKTNSIEALQ